MADDTFWRGCDSRLQPMQHALANMCVICPDCVGKMTITAEDNGKGGFSVELEECSVCGPPEIDGEYDLPSDTKDPTYDPDYQHDVDLDTSSNSDVKGTLASYKPATYSYYYEGILPKKVEFHRASASVPWIKVNRDDDNAESPSPKELPQVTPAKKQRPPPEKKSLPHNPYSKKQPQPSPPANKKMPLLVNPYAKKSPPAPKAKKKEPPAASKASFLEDDVQPDTSSSGEDGLFCRFCGKDPCLWLQMETDIVKFDTRRNNNVGGDQAVGWNERNANCRWRSYSFATYILHGYLGIHNQKRLPKCVVAGIRALFPSKDGKYTDYNPARHRKK